MSAISIRKLENLSQVKAHTIRIWEQRYRLLNPERKKGNVRIYSPQDVELLLKVVFLNNLGVRISRLAGLQTRELDTLIESYRNEEEQLTAIVNNLIIAMFYSDAPGFEQILNSTQETFGLDLTIRRVVLPFLEKVGLMSYAERSNEVHLVVTAVRRKIILGIEMVTPRDATGKTALLFLPDGEHYDLLLLYTLYILKLNGHRTIYLGTNVPMANVQSMALAKCPDYLFLHQPVGRKFDVKSLSAFIENHLPASKIYVVSPRPDAAAAEQAFTNVRFISYKEL